MALRKLDVAILALCAVAIILSMHQEGDLSLEPSWYFEVDSRSSTMDTDLMSLKYYPSLL